MGVKRPLFWRLNIQKFYNIQFQKLEDIFNDCNSLLTEKINAEFHGKNFIESLDHIIQFSSFPVTKEVICLAKITNLIGGLMANLDDLRHGHKPD